MVPLLTQHEYHKKRPFKVFLGKWQEPIWESVCGQTKGLCVCVYAFEYCKLGLSFGNNKTNVLNKNTSSCIRETRATVINIIRGHLQVICTRNWIRWTRLNSLLNYKSLPSYIRIEIAWDAKIIQLTRQHFKEIYTCKWVRGILWSLLLIFCLLKFKIYKWTQVWCCKIMEKKEMSYRVNTQTK